MEHRTPATESPFATRILDLVRAEALRADLTVAVDNLGTSLGTHLNDCDETLHSALSVLQDSAKAQWLHGPEHGMSVDNYRHHRDAIVGRANALHRRATAAAAAAGQLADLLTVLEPFDTDEDLYERIDTAGEDLADMGTDIEREAYLAHLWTSLEPGPAVDEPTAESLRRHFDTILGNTALGAPGRDTVDAWRRAHLQAAEWDADTFTYAIGTARSWNELIELWERLAPAVQDGRITTGQNIRLRDALTARVRVNGHTPALPPRLTELLTEYDTDGIALAARIRHAEDWATLRNVWEALKPGTHLERLAMVRALLRAARAMQTREAPQFTYDGQTLMSELDAWHRQLSATAAGIPDGSYDTEEAYTILSHAVAAATDTGNVAREHQLIGIIEAARAAGRITEDQHARIAATLTPAVKVAPA